jgi:hypothetical protein
MKIVMLYTNRDIANREFDRALTGTESGQPRDEKWPLNTQGDIALLS